MVLSTSLSGLSIQPTSTMKKSGKVSLVSANVACCSATFILVYTPTHTTHTTHTTYVHTGVHEVEHVSENQTLPPQERDTYTSTRSVSTNQKTAPRVPFTRSCKPTKRPSTSSPPTNFTQMTAIGSTWGVTFVLSALINSIVRSL